MQKTLGRPLLPGPKRSQKDLLHPPLTTFGDFPFVGSFPGPQHPKSGRLSGTRSELCPSVKTVLATQRKSFPRKNRANQKPELLEQGRGRPVTELNWSQPVLVHQPMQKCLQWDRSNLVYATEWPKPGLRTWGLGTISCDFPGRIAERDLKPITISRPCPFGGDSGIFRRIFRYESSGLKNRFACQLHPAKVRL